MKKLYLNCIVLFVCLFASNLQAKEVNKQTAEKVAINAFSQLENNKNASHFQIKEILTVKSEEETSFYVVNFNPTGFIILSASDAAVPILGSSTESNFSLENLPPQLSYLLDSYKKQIKEIEKQKIAPTKEIKQKWEKYSEASGINSNSLKSASTILTTVSPLMQTHWGQKEGWNRHCPANDSGPNDHCLVGCTAVALAQVLKYWACQVNESGTIIDSNYNNLTVNLTNSDYQWDNMGLTTSDNYNARLLYDCALAVQTDFGPTNSDGYVSAAISTLVNNYGFKNTIIEESSSSYSDSDWKVKLKNELNQGRPIIYSAVDPANEAHAWIIDGYDSNDKFSCNWGWPEHQTLESYYYINNLNPLYFNFSNYHWAVTNIEPVMPNCNGITASSAVICPSGSSCSVTGIPESATVTWQTSSNITQLSSQPSNPATFVPNGTGNGWVKATVNYNGSATLEPINIWVDNPNYTFQVTRTDGNPVTNDEYGNLSFCPYTDYEIYITPNGVPCYSSDQIWTVPSTWTINYNNYSTISINTNDDPYNFIAVDFKSCCSDEDLYLSQYFEYSSSCAQYLLAITPNPSSSETSLSIVSKTDIKIDESIEWYYEVYDSKQSLKAKSQNIKGSKQILNISSWKDGVYIVRVKVGKEILSEKLVVKH